VSSEELVERKLQFWICGGAHRGLLEEGTMRSTRQIAIVSPRYGAEIVGGAEFHAKQIAEHLSKYFDVEVLTTCAKDYLTWKNEYRKGTEIINDIVVRRFEVEKERNMDKFRKIEEKVFYGDTHTVDDEYLWVDLQGPDSPSLIEYIHKNKDNYDYFIFFTFRYFHTVYGLHHVSKKSLLAPLAEDDPALDLEIAKNVVFNSAQAISFNSPEEKTMIERRVGKMDKFGDIVGCGIAIPEIDENMIGKTALKYNLSDYIVYLGRIDGIKGCYTLFDFFIRYINDSDVDIDLVLAGFEVIKVPKHPNIKFLGFVSEKEKFALLKGAKLLIMPSIAESLSLVTLESLGIGTPVLVNGNCNVLKGHCLRSNAGLYYTNYDEFKGGLELLFSNGKLREKMGENGRQYVEGDYSWQKVEEKYIRLLNKISHGDHEMKNAQGAKEDFEKPPKTNENPTKVYIEDSVTRSKSKSSEVYPIFLDYPIDPIPRYGYGKPVHSKLYEIIDMNRRTYRDTLKSFLNFKDYFLGISREKSRSREPYWINEWMPGLDAVAIYSFLCLNNPRRYFEIGSGNSSKFARRAINDHTLQTKITSIDPHPRAEIDSICNMVIRSPLENVDLEIFDELEAGDILFIDGSHRTFMNSDVTVCFLDILPRLKPGVLIGFHDIYLPYDYPPEWQDRYYSEQYLLATYILGGGDKFEIILPCTFISQEKELKDILLPLWSDHRMRGVETHGGSFWIINKRGKKSNNGKRYIKEGKSLIDKRNRGIIMNQSKMENKLFEKLVEKKLFQCPSCHGRIFSHFNERLDCMNCNSSFEIRNGVVDFFNNYINNKLENIAIPKEITLSLINKLQLPNSKINIQKINEIIHSSFRKTSRNHLTSEINLLLERFNIENCDFPVNKQVPKFPINLDYEISYEKHYFEKTLQKSKIIHRNVRIKNNGNSKWSSNTKNPIHLSYRWIKDDGNFLNTSYERTKFPIDICPQRSITVPLKIKTPSETGNYTLQILLVHENVRLVEDKPLNVPIEIKDISPKISGIKFTNKSYSYAKDHEVARDILQNILENQYHDQKIAILEVGGGTHPQSAFLSNIDYVVNIDISMPLLELGSVYYSHHHKELFENHLCFVCCDAVTAPLADECFDAIVLFSTLHHFPDPALFLENISRLLKKEGFIAILCEPVGNNLHQDVTIRDLSKGINEQVFSLEEYLSIFDRAGLTIKFIQVDDGSLKTVLKKAGKR
jgi:glycosyltransferase involved in cell wall biosynthesis/ubiquinone/menaquinone biosynthesis C-methylase UbiE